MPPSQKKAEAKKPDPAQCEKQCADNQWVQFLTILVVMAIGFVFGQLTPNLIGDRTDVDMPQIQTQQAANTVQPAPAQQQASGPAWIVRCGDRVEGQPRRKCEMVQSISVRETGQRVAEMALTAGYQMADDGEVMDMIGGLVLIPLGVSTEDGLIIRIDQSQQARQFPIQGCAAQGCQARIAFTREEAGRMAEGETLSLIARNTQGKPVVIPMSLDGFGAAMEEMQRRAFADG